MPQRLVIGAADAPPSFDWYRRQKERAGSARRRRLFPPAGTSNVPTAAAATRTGARSFEDVAAHSTLRRRARARPLSEPVRGLARLFSAVAMKAKVKSHVQQARNMSGFKGKFAPAPPISKRPREAYVPKLPNPETGENPFAKQLANGDKDVRDATFAALAKWLGARGDVELLDMKKIWKGLFYAMWHADGWDVQEELAEQMAGLVHKLKHKVALSYAGVFYITARREWVGIDRHRMDKYLLLVRRVTSHFLRYCADRDWSENVVADVAECLHRTALVPGGHGEKGVVDVGLKLHLAELFVPELRKVAAGRDGVEVGCDPEKDIEANGGAPRTVFRKKREKNGKKDHVAKPAPKPVPPHATRALLEAFAKMLAMEPHRALHRRTLSDVFAEAVDGADGGVAAKTLADEDADEDERRECAAAVLVRLDAATMKKMSREFIELGAQDGTEDLNRESLYELHTLFRKGAKRATATGEGGVDAPNVGKKMKKAAPEPEPESSEEEEGGEEEMDEDESGEELEDGQEEEEESEEEDDESDDESDDEDEPDESFHTAPDDSMAVDGSSEEEEESDEEDEDDSSEEDAEGKPESFDDVSDPEDDDETDEESDEDEELAEVDEFEEADEFDEEMEVDEEDEGEEEEEEEEEEEDSFDNSDQDNSEEEEEEASESGSSDEDEDEDAEMARQEAAIAAATAAAERKALRKAERWAMAVGATPPPKGSGASYLAHRALGERPEDPLLSPHAPTRVFGSPLGSLDTVRKDVLSPSKRVAWNLKRNTRHTPTGPPNPVRGEGLRALLGSTPTKGLLRPIHAAKVPLSDPRGKKTVGGKSPGGKGSRAETMTPGRRRAKASDFF